MKAAVLKNHAEAVNYLLEKGAKIDVKMAVESHLHIACMHGCLETVLVLAKSKAQTELRDFKKRTPLISAAASHSANDERMVKMCEFLVKRGANIDAVDEKGATALHHAASRYRPKTVAALLRLGADATRKDKKGKTALERARMYHQKNPHYGTEVIKKLESR